MPMLDTMKKILPAEVRKAAAARTLTVKISSGTVDRDNDVINPRGWRFAQYLANPVVLWSHDKSIPAIARTLSVRVVGDAVLAECEFPPEGIHELADLVYDLATMGFIHSASVGFLPIKYLRNAERDGYDIEEQELLEWSFVNIPANYQAQIQRCLGAGCDLPAMKSWLSGSSKAPCACGGDEVLDIRDERFLEISEPATYLELSEDFIFTDDLPSVNRAMRRVIQRELANVIARETSAAIRAELLYQAGRVD